ncbi:MAG: hypothetical protein K1X64_13215 [Myxococcaceae bacterium]|nr:hypothetical protein [Myxococcaceae bacterium]
MSGSAEPHATLQALESALAQILKSPKDGGVVRLIARRPDVGEREVVEEATLDVQQGLVGDNWKTRGAKSTPHKAPHPLKQVNLMNARVVQAVALTRERWALAGDQLYVDMDLSEANLPVGTRLEIGSAVLEITPPLHLGCGKFAARFGADAIKFVNTPEHRPLRFRGVHTQVIQGGVVREGDRVMVLRTSAP